MINVSACVCACPRMNMCICVYSFMSSICVHDQGNNDSHPCTSTPYTPHTCSHSYSLRPSSLPLTQPLIPLYFNVNKPVLCPPVLSPPQPLRTVPSLISSSVACEADIKSALKSFRSSLQVPKTVKALLIFIL